MSEIASPWQVARVAAPADLEPVLDIERLSFTNPTTRQWYENELQRPDVCFLYVLCNPQINDGLAVGFCAFWRVIDQMHINNLAIHPAHRGQGLGRRLLHAVLHEASRLGVDAATLEVRRSNEAARRLYEGSGFQLVGVRTSYYTNPIEDALILPRTEW